MVGLNDSEAFGLAEETTETPSPSPYHTFCDAAEVELLRSQLLGWYDREKRELPWRTLVNMSFSFTGLGQKLYYYIIFLDIRTL